MTKYNRIAEFANGLLIDDHFRSVYIRLPRTSAAFANHKSHELRTAKHSADVIGHDCLGNVTVLWGDGRIQQLFIEEAKAAGLLR